MISLVLLLLSPAIVDLGISCSAESHFRSQAGARLVTSCGSQAKDNPGCPGHSNARYLYLEKLQAAYLATSQVTNVPNTRLPGTAAGRHKPAAR
jgi:hypothetical protein